MKLTLGKIKATKTPIILGRTSLVGKKLNISKNLDDKLWNTSQEQIITSAKTSRPQISAGNKKIQWTDNTTNLDLGGGRYDQNTEYLVKKKCKKQNIRSF